MIQKLILLFGDKKKHFLSPPSCIAKSLPISIFPLFYSLSDVFFFSPGLIFFFNFTSVSTLWVSSTTHTHAVRKSTAAWAALLRVLPPKQFDNIILLFKIKFHPKCRHDISQMSNKDLQTPALVIVFFGQDLHTDVTFMISVALIPRESGVKYRRVDSDVINDGRACCAETKAGAASLSVGATFSRLLFYFALGSASHAGRVSVDRLSTAALHIVSPTTGLHDELFLKMRLLPWKHVIHHISLCPSLGL